jgi:hypothetical protein
VCRDGVVMAHITFSFSSFLNINYYYFYFFFKSLKCVRIESRKAVYIRVKVVQMVNYTLKLMYYSYFFVSFVFLNKKKTRKKTKKNRKRCGNPTA